MRTRRGILRAGAGLATLSAGWRARAASSYQPPGSLIDAAKREGRLVLYTAAYTEVEQDVFNLFNRSYPFVKIEMVRASGGQLITRVRSEAAAGKLQADIVDHFDSTLMAGLADLFRDYAPPNPEAYRPETITAGKL